MGKSSPYTKVSSKDTPQTEALEGQVANSAGGFSYQVDDWMQLQRFLILGSEGGTYYVNEQKLTRDNAKAVERCIAADGMRVVREVVEISSSGRAYKNDPALFVHAMAAKLGNDETRKFALDNLNDVARTGTHLEHWVQFVEQFGGWGTGTKRAVQKWFTSKDRQGLGYQVVKYAQRDGWGMRDILRLAKPHSDTHGGNLSQIFEYVVRGPGNVDLRDTSPVIIGAEMLKTEKDPTKAAKIIADHGVPREAVPTELLKSKEVWEALLASMPMTAMIRNLATMTRIDLLKHRAVATDKVISQLQNTDVIRRARVHPVTILAALRTYSAGRSDRGKNTWTPVQRIVDALDEAFYESFHNIVPTGKNFLLGIDVSSSMGGGNCAGLQSLTPREGAAAMAMVTARSETNYQVMGFARTFREIKISPNDRLDDVCRKISMSDFGSTDCSLPMKWAAEKGLKFDIFCVYTDSETYAGRPHPVQALQSYRQKFVHNAKLAVIAMESNPFSIADPKDAGMMDFVGFDAAAPQVLADFARS